MAYEPNQMTPSGSTAPVSYPEGTSSDEIRRDIDRTRAEMDSTVDALQERLKPRHLLDDILEAFRKSSAGNSMSAAGSQASDTLKDVGTKVLDKLKAHPMPAALIGAGITWLMFEGDGSSRRTPSGYVPRKWDVPEHSGSYVDARTGQPYTSDYGHEDSGRGGYAGGASGDSGPGVTGRAKEAMSGVGDKMSGAAASAKDKASGAVQSAKEVASSIADKASNWIGSARDSASETGSAFGEYASGASGQASHGYRASKHYVERGIEEYPLAMGAAAMALGVIAGLLLPHTSAEDRWVGKQADNLKERASDTGQQLMDSGKQVVAATASAAQDEMGSQGAGVSSLVEKVKHVAQDVARTASESAKREGLDPDSLAQKGKQVAERAKETAKDEVQRQKDQTSL